MSGELVGPNMHCPRCGEVALMPQSRHRAEGTYLTCAACAWSVEVEVDADEGTMTVVLEVELQSRPTERELDDALERHLAYSSDDFGPVGSKRYDPAAYFRRYRPDVSGTPF